MIKPIETIYKGYRFRSRLEARWAVFFDAIGLDWEYEKEGFDVDGTPYLPDFWINEGEGYWIEVKPDFIEDTDKAEKYYDMLYKLSQGFRPGFLLIGSPNPVEIIDFKIIDGPFAFAFQKLLSKDVKIPYRIDPRPYCWQERKHDNSVILWPCPAMEPILPDELKNFPYETVPFFGESGYLFDVCFNPGSSKSHNSPKLITAYLKARQARFEHGEKG